MPFEDPWIGTGDPVRQGILIQVYRINTVEGSGDEEPDDFSPELLPSVACLEIEKREGPYPRTAIFRYKFDGLDDESPQTFQDALSTAVTTDDLAHLVEIGDRLGVLATRPDGNTYWIFLGSPLVWSFQLAPDRESVTMHAVGDEKRAWDVPIGGAIVRGSEDPEDVVDVDTDLPLQFNPRGVPNASPSSADSGEDPYKYPVTMDPGVEGTDGDGEDYPRTFTLPMAVASLLFSLIDQEPPITDWITFPTRADLEALLVAREPIDGTPFDPTDDSTYNSKDIQAPDTPMTGRAWPERVYALVKDSGFGMTFDIGVDDDPESDGDPSTYLRLFLRQGGAVKPLLLQAEYTPFDASLTNLGEAQIGRDLSGVANEWDVVGAMKAYECSLVLAPAFPSAKADAASPLAFVNSGSGFEMGGNYNTYRLWVFDEVGDGTYPNNPPGNAGPTVIAGEGTGSSLDAVLGAPDDDGNPAYVKRYRKPIGTLFTKNPDTGLPFPFKVEISTDYAGGFPKVWDGTGTWQAVDGFTLLKDRIGVRLHINDPNNFGTGPVEGGPFVGGVVKVVNCIGAPDAQNPTFYVMLTCVIEGDQALKVTAPRIATSPLDNVIVREVDARDRLFLNTVAAHSKFSASATVVRDDTELANAEAIAYRTAMDSGVMEGTVVVPRFTLAYDVGDRISSIDGRGLGLRTDNGGTNYAPVYPVVVSRRFVLEGAQHTILELSDSGLDRRPYGLKRRAAPEVPAKDPRSIAVRGTDY